MILLEELMPGYPESIPPITAPEGLEWDIKRHWLRKCHFTIAGKINPREISRMRLDRWWIEDADPQKKFFDLPFEFLRGKKDILDCPKAPSMNKLIFVELREGFK